MIEDLTWMALEEVCRLLSSETVPGLDAVSVNLSMQQLLNRNLVQHLLELLSPYGLSPSRLRLEITERFLLHDAQYARQQLGALQAAGFQIYMDDFGVGYSNLSSVLDHPLDCIKLDRSLIRRVPSDLHARIMVETLLTLFHNWQAPGGRGRGNGRAGSVFISSGCRSDPGILLCPPHASGRPGRILSKAGG